MKFRIRKKWIIRFIIIILFIGSIGFIWYKYQIKRGAGGYTEILNSESFFQNYERIGIKNISILHPKSDYFIPNQNVILKSGIIQSISPVENIDSSIQYIDGTDKFLIPGLTDTHVHLLDSKNDLLLYFANGITSIWEMFGNQTHLDWKIEYQEGNLISPELFIATGKVGSQKGAYGWGSKYFGGQINFTSVETTRKGIKNFKQKGFDAIKLGSFLNEEIYDAIIDEAKKQHLPVLGHLSTDVGLERMYKSGLSELAHVEEITKNVMSDFGGMDYDNTAEFIDYLKSRADSIAINLRENYIAVSTTIWLMESLPEQKFNLDNFLKTLEIEYANPALIEGTIIRKGWLSGNNHYENLEIKNDFEKRQKSEIWWKAYVEAIHIMTKALRDNNTPILAGTDANATCVVPGFSLHNELESLVNIGLTSSEAIYSATVAPSKWMKKKSGEIKIGYEADLVLLSANPLENIAHTKSIEFVFADNFYLTKNNREKLLENLKKVNNESRNINITK